MLHHHHPVFHLPRAVDVKSDKSEHEVGFEGADETHDSVGHAKQPDDNEQPTEIFSDRGGDTSGFESSILDRQRGAKHAPAIHGKDRQHVEEKEHSVEMM